MEKPQNCVIVIFGASGDLTIRKLMPAIYDLYRKDLLPDSWGILGVSRTSLTDNEFRLKQSEGIRLYSGQSADEITLLKFLDNVHYISLDPQVKSEYLLLKERLDAIAQTKEATGNYLFYLATPPLLYEPISENLASVNLNRNSGGYRRLIVEKPFGYDLDSGIKLNVKLHEAFDEDEICRIDHYLGKETVQNLLVTRFANGIFEPLWNRNYIDHVEITSAESIGVENRGGYYDSSGALRDMLQNHLLHLVAITAMEPPSSFDSNAIRNETFKVFQSLRPLKADEIDKFVIRGQYTASKIRGEAINGYRDEKGVGKDSRTETYVALKFFIDNWRWGGVPFYIRTGKRLPTRVTEIVIHFKPTPHYLFSKNGDAGNCNQLVIRIQPDEGILLKFGMKVPGAGFNVKTVNMDFHYEDLKDVYVPAAYERLLQDAMTGDSTLYARGDAVEAAWKFLTPIQTSWNKNPNSIVYGYPAGTWGPEDADSLIEGENMSWRYPCKNLADDGEYCEL